VAKQRRNRPKSRADGRPGNAGQRPTQDRRDRASALRAVQVREEARNRRMRALTIIGAALLAIVLVITIAFVTRKHPKSGTATSLAPTSVVQQTTSVPPSVFAQIGKGDASGPKPVSGQPVADRDGHPTVLYVGAEWCPYCATERWPMVVALSRFGTFSNLGRTESSPSDVYPRTQTFSMHGTTYTSQFLTLDAKEVQSNQVSGRQYATLDRLDSEENSAFKAGGSGFPYINLAGKYLMPTQLDPKVLQGKTMEQIAAALSDPTSDIAQAVDGAANVFTAALCKLTGDQPADICTAAPIPALESTIGGKS
jgi:thiol-disulfide isomerase/thioredoxin